MAKQVNDDRMSGNISDYTSGENSDIDTDLRDLTQKVQHEEKLDSNDALSIDIPKINSIMKERHSIATIKYGLGKPKLPGFLRISCEFSAFCDTDSYTILKDLVKESEVTCTERTVAALVTQCTTLIETKNSDIKNIVSKVKAVLESTPATSKTRGQFFSELKKLKSYWDSKLDAYMNRGSNSSNSERKLHRVKRAQGGRDSFKPKKRKSVKFLQNNDSIIKDLESLKLRVDKLKK